MSTMNKLYKLMLNTFANVWIVKDDDPLTILVVLLNHCEATLIDMGKYWQVLCKGRDFVVKTPGVLGLRLGLMQALTMSEEVAAVIEILLESGYKKVDPLYSEWLVFCSPNAECVSISTATMNNDPRGLWSVYSHNDSVKRYVREVCMSVRGFDNVI